MNTTTTAMPKTVRELGEMADNLGIKPSETLQMLGTIPMPPAGYVLAEGCSDVWTGQEIAAAGMVLIPTWNYTSGLHAIELWTGKGTADETMVILTPAEAAQLADALATVSRAAVQPSDRIAG